jgi:hypothetical protein
LTKAQALIDAAVAQFKLTRYGYSSPPTGHMKAGLDLLALARADLDPAYVNPFRHATGLVPKRIDDGVDYWADKDAPIEAIGKAKILRADPSSGWPGGTAIWYVLLEGPNAGEHVYLSEFCSIEVKVGQIVPAGFVISRFRLAATSGVGIEHGFCVGGNSQKATPNGKAFARLLKSLGCPVRDDPGPGTSHGKCT